MAATSQQIQAYLNAAMGLTDAIKELGRVPSGELYATCMGHMDLSTYEGLIRHIVNTGLVQKSGDVLIWKGPEA